MGELGSASEDKVLEEEQEMERTCTTPKNSRKGDIDGAEAEQHKVDGKSRLPKGGAAYGRGSHALRVTH